jgi:signal transduction histidine kinase
VTAHDATTRLTEGYRESALGAYAHDVRTPLTAIQMLLDLARDGDGGLHFDPELASMLIASVDELQQLTDAMHEFSRLERGRLQVSRGPAALQTAMAAATERLGGRIRLSGAPAPAVSGPWDPDRLPRALAGLLLAADRAGEGSGTVRTTWSVEPAAVHGVFESGQDGGVPRAADADAGFVYYSGSALLRAMRGEADLLRTDRWCAVSISLPLT